MRIIGTGAPGLFDGCPADPTREHTYSGELMDYGEAGERYIEGLERHVLGPF